MFRSQEMVKATLFAHTSERERILKELHRLGIIQLIDLKSEKLEIPQAAPAGEIREISDLLLRVSHCNHILKLAPRKINWQMNLFGLETLRKARVERRDKRSLAKEATAFLKEHEEELLKLEQRYEKAKERIAETQEQEHLIALLKEHNLPPALLHDTEKLTVRSGRVPNGAIPPLKHELGEIGEVHLEQREHGPKESIVLVVALQEHASRISFLLKKYGVVTFAIPEIPDVKDPLAWVRQEQKRARKERDDALKRIRTLQKHLDESIYLREELELLKERFDAIHRMRESTSFFVLRGWVTRRELETLESIKGIHVETEEAHGENVPVELSNPGWLKPFEVLTELYAPPKYKDLDPTFIVGPLFLVYAGFMLTDFFYGLGLVVLGLILVALFKRHDTGVTNVSISIAGIGAFSMLFGILTGSYLGDAPKALFGPTLLGFATDQLAIWRDPLAEPLYFLILSLVVGLVHLNIGLILGAIEDVRKQQWKTLVQERLVWWLLQLAVLGYALNWGMASHILLGVTILLVIVLHGPLGLLGMTGFMGDVISYSRLFALALSTAGIAMTVNLLAVMLGGIPYVGFLLAAIIFIAGHLFSFAMNALGSFVHSIRLQFVEFFGKFYEGGGDKFEPFKEERVYTEVAE